MSALFEPHEPHDIIVKYDMYLHLLSFLYLDKNPRWVPDCWFGGVRFVVNQSVVPVNSESSPEDRSQLSAVLYSEVIFLLIIRYVMSIVF